MQRIDLVEGDRANRHARFSERWDSRGGDERRPASTPDHRRRPRHVGRMTPVWDHVNERRVVGRSEGMSEGVGADGVPRRRPEHASDHRSPYRRTADLHVQVDLDTRDREPVTAKSDDYTHSRGPLWSNCTPAYRSNTSQQRIIVEPFTFSPGGVVRHGAGSAKGHSRDIA